MNQEKTLCCPECGSDDIAFEAWVDEHNNYINRSISSIILEDTGNYVVCCNSNCEVCNEEIRPILKSEFKKEEA